MRSGTVWLLTASLGLAVIGLPATSEATTLCKTKKGGLVIREKCKKKEVTVDAQVLGGLGLSGPPGPPGPAGPSGPSGGGLSVVDAGGQDVGIVYDMGVGYYGGTYTNVVREMSAGGGTEFFAFGVSRDGFVTYDDYYGYGLYQAADCTGPKFDYVSCEYGECEGPAPLFTSLAIAEDLKGSYSVLSERINGDFYSSSTFSGSTPEEVTSNCASRGGGTIQGTIAACEFDATRVCGLCCTPSPDTDASPSHIIDLAPLNLVPPFKLKR